jgi:hypothetical protein
VKRVWRVTWWVVTGVLPRGRVCGAQHGLGNKGLGKMGLSDRVVE